MRAVKFFWRRWVRQPQTLWLRRAMFQVHLWIGLLLGLYVVVLCVTGSALVYRDVLDEAFETPAPAFEPGRRPLSSDQLTAAAQRAYPGYEVTRVGNRFNRRRPVIEIWVERGGERIERLFSPYTGEDLGPALHWVTRANVWLASLHDELLLGQRGRLINGLASVLLTLVCLTGAIVWWPGVRHWRRGVAVKWRASWPRMNFDLHSATGFWFFLLILMWAATSVYLAIPEPFAALVDRFSEPDEILGRRTGDIILRWGVRLHFGRWEDRPALMAVWAVLGMIPAVMAVTGAIMWWHRVLRKRQVRPADVET
ncbi:MAG: PepSY domain-containing protein [Acidobacteria bacterium]|nr:PepSY domain-containing protein [Acidobacteriota bacterium]